MSRPVQTNCSAALQLVFRALCLPAFLLIGVGCSAAESDLRARYSGVIEQGLYQDFNLARVPYGEIVILTPLQVSLGAVDLKARRFAPDALAPLRTWQKHGLLELREHPQTSREALNRMGATTFSIIPSSFLREIADTALAEDGYLMVPLSRPVIEEIVTDTAYQAQNLSASEQYRLVLGTYRLSSSELSARLGDTTTVRRRFKAVLKYDPFQERFTYVTADWGRLGETEWATRRVR